MKVISREWDRLTIYLLLMAYGAYSTVYPIVSFQRVSPYWAELALGIEFFVAGGLLMLGLLKPGYRMAGLMVVAIGLTTISTTVAIVGGTRVLAYAFLFGAFAMQSVADIREERRRRLERKAGTARLAEEVLELVNGIRQGDR